MTNRPSFKSLFYKLNPISDLNRSDENSADIRLTFF